VVLVELAPEPMAEHAGSAEDEDSHGEGESGMAEDGPDLREAEQLALHALDIEALGVV
jgi:hypothetical protein